MSARHPIIAITGSSGAGTTSVMRTFEQIFRREGVRAAFVEGDSFHRYDRAAMKAAMAKAERAGVAHFSHFGDEANPIAFLIEQAGGRATTGRERVLEVKPSQLHQRIGFVFGSREEVERIERYHAESAGDPEDQSNPLYGFRGLYRASA